MDCIGPFLCPAILGILGCLFLPSDGCLGTVIQYAVTVVGKVLADSLTNFLMTGTSFCVTNFHRPSVGVFTNVVVFICMDFSSSFIFRA
jgi:uncharacterized membrane protein YeaQ/YmgE (transglycosylase-associated protein family)